MNKNSFIRIIAALVVTIVLACLPIGSTADGEMAYNIYSDPDLSATSRAFKSFVIDFCATKRLIHTYWALCNWQMNLFVLVRHLHAILI